MSRDRVGDILHYLYRLTGGKGSGAPSDRELVERFVATHEEEAFAELMRLHGAMVLAVAKRVLGDVHRAEDVFQATFLVFARKAGSIRRKDAIAGWLAQIAYHLALRSRTAVARQQASELATLNGEQGITMSAELDRKELGRILDEELHGMPEKLHTPLVLCYLEGKTYEEAARHLNWPLGTFKDRVSKARTVLRKRLLRRGVALGTATAAMAELTRDVAAAQVGPELLRNVLRAALVFAAGASLEAGPAATLAEGMLRGTAVAKWKFAVGLFLALIIAGAAGALVYSRTAGPAPTADLPPKVEHPASKAALSVPAPKEVRIVNGLRLDLSADAQSFPRKDGAGLPRAFGVGLLYENTQTSLRPEGQGAEPVTFTLVLANVQGEPLVMRWPNDLKRLFPKPLTLEITDDAGKKEIGILRIADGLKTSSNFHPDDKLGRPVAIEYKAVQFGADQVVDVQLDPDMQIALARFALSAPGIVLKEPGRYRIRVMHTSDAPLNGEPAERIISNEVVVTVRPAPR